MSGPAAQDPEPNSRTKRRRTRHAPRTAPGSHHGRRELVGRAWTREQAVQWLEAPGRRESEDPDELWNRVVVAVGDTVVEVGAGTGFFAIPAARRVGPSGRVLAVDLSEDLVELLRGRRETEALAQLIPIRSTRVSIPLRSSIADIVLLANVLHDIPDSTLSEAVRLVKSEGRLVNMDWKKEGTPGGPPTEVRLTPRQAKTRLEEQGLVAIDQWEFGPWHYAMVLKRSGKVRNARYHLRGD